ncbi:hypothetical protein [Kineococcus sp. SYSU DK005]|uniref:hypothetical protein n=1 Tax=Kineococcus sp. SYSU DK005 TaxID=3383126 RepID=UPI003D7C4BD5
MTDEEFDALWNRACEWDAPAIRTHRGDEGFSAAADDARGDVPEERINASCLLDTDALGAAVRATVQASPQSFAPLG